MKSTRVEGNSSNFFSLRQLHLDFFLLRVIIPNFDELIGSGNAELFTKTDIHAHDWTIVVLLMYILKIDLIWLASVKCYVYFHQLAMFCNKEEVIFIITALNGSNVVVFLDEL